MIYPEGIEHPLPNAAQSQYYIAPQSQFGNLIGAALIRAGAAQPF
jgi:hypothetical protein